jgi:hypothetical protein
MSHSPVSQNLGSYELDLERHTRIQQDQIQTPVLEKLFPPTVDFMDQLLDVPSVSPHQSQVEIEDVSTESLDAETVDVDVADGV